MHPVIRILMLLLCAVMMVWGGWFEWLFMLLLVVSGFILSPLAKFKPALKMMQRLRWLLLSILIIYLFYTPGVPLWPGIASGLPTQEGLLNGGHRIAVLLLLVAAVSLLLQSTPIAQMIAALLWLLRPFSLFGFPYERLAVRLGLTMEAVTELQDMIVKTTTESQGVRQRIQAFAAQMVDLFDQVTQHARSLPCQTIEVPILMAPSVWQWLMLFLISGVFLLL